MLRNWLLKRSRPYPDKHPRFRQVAVDLDTSANLVKHGVATVMPFIIRPTPRQLSVAITTSCNYGCMGCRYGRDFMPGHHLKLAMAARCSTTQRLPE